MNPQNRLHISDGTRDPKFQKVGRKDLQRHLVPFCTIFRRGLQNNQALNEETRLRQLALERKKVDLLQLIKIKFTP